MDTPLPILPVSVAVVGKYPADWWKQQAGHPPPMKRVLLVDLRLVPTIALLAAAGLLWAGYGVPAFLAAIFPPLIAARIWPLSGGPMLPLLRRDVAGDGEIGPLC